MIEEAFSDLYVAPEDIWAMFKAKESILKAKDIIRRVRSVIE